MATGKCFFFKGDKYVRFDIASNRADPGYPRLIADDWVGMKEAGFDRDLDGAVYWGDWRLYFFKGEQFVLFDLRVNKVKEGAPWPIASQGNWGGMQNAGFGADVDAGVNWGSHELLYFFKGDQYIRFNMSTNHMDGNGSGPIYNPRDSDVWPGLNQGDFARGIDAALNWGDERLYFFKGDNFIRFDTTTNRAEGVPTPIDSPNNWNGLAAAGFDSDIDAATRLGGDRPYQGPEPRTTPSPSPSVCDLMQAGVVSLSSSVAPAVTPKDTGSFTSVTFPKPFPAGSQVVVVPMVQTFNGPDTPGVRIDDVTITGFKIRINELVTTDGKGYQALSDGKHDPETIGWLAFTA